MSGALRAAEPFSVDDLFLGLVTGGLLFALGIVAVRHRVDRPLIAAALAFKLAASVASAAIPYFYYLPDFVNDNITYHELGVAFAEEIRLAPGEGVAEHLATALSASGLTISTDRFNSASALLHVVLWDSFVASGMVLGALAFGGQMLLYDVLTREYPSRRLRLWWAGTLLLPSLVFWGSGLYKDSLGMAGLGCAVWGAQRFAHGGPRGTLIPAVAGVYVLALYRVQVLPPLVLALVPWLLLSRQVERWRSLVLGIPLTGGFAAILILGAVDPRFSLELLPQSILFELSQAERRVFAGSNLDVPLVTDATWGSLLAAWPAALVVVLFRPFPWEAPGLLGLLAAAENTLLLVLCLRAVRQLATIRGALAGTLRSPLFLACVVFVAVYALEIGATQPNLGTLSRYRIPLLPFVLAGLAIVDGNARRTATALAGDR